MSARARWSAALSSSGRDVLVALMALALLAGLQAVEQLPLQTRWRAALFDGYQELAPRERRSAPVVIVDIDEASLQRYGQWPWPRSLLAQLVARVSALEPAAIGLDILMPEPDRASPCTAVRFVPGAASDLVDRICALPSNDALLAAALRESRAVVSVAGIDRPGGAALRAAPLREVGGDSRPSLHSFRGALTSVSELHEAAAGHAIVSADPEHGILRQVVMAANVGGRVLPSLAIEMLRLAAAEPGFTLRSAGGRIEAVEIGDLSVPTQSDGRLWVHYGRFDPGRYVSAEQVLAGTIDAERFRRRLVLVGVSGLGLVDYPMTGLGERVPGVEVHAQVLESIFDGATLARPRWAAWLELSVVVLLGVAMIAAARFARLATGWAIVLVPLAAVMIIGGGFLLYAKRQLLIDAATPTLVLFALLVGLIVRDLVRVQRQRRALEATLREQREAAARTAGEVAAARRIQLGMVPDASQVFALEPRLDVAARMIPAREVGGDLYDCFMLDADRAFFIVGDVCGKGIPASLFMATSKTLCKSVALRDNLDLGALMQAANREITRDNAEMLFVTVFAAILDLRSGELAFTLAGHDPPYLAAPGRSPRRLQCEGGVPLGIDEAAEFPVVRCQLAPGEVLCAITDGVTEATDPSGAFFGRERLEKALSAMESGAGAAGVLSDLLIQVDRFAAGSEPADDVTVLAFRWNGVS